MPRKYDSPCIVLYTRNDAGSDPQLPAAVDTYARSTAIDHLYYNICESLLGYISHAFGAPEAPMLSDRHRKKHSRPLYRLWLPSFQTLNAGDMARVQSTAFGLRPEEVIQQTPSSWKERTGFHMLLDWHSLNDEFE